MTTGTADITTAELITAVRTHALAHAEDGWDIITEATTDAELARLIGVVRTAKAAIAKVAKYVKLKAEQRAAIDAQATGKTTAKTAKTTTPKPAADQAAARMAVINRAAPPAAPAAAITITNLTDAGLNLVYLLAASPVSSSTLSPAVAFSLKALAAKGIAQLAPSTGTERVYDLTDTGRSLVAILWPAMKVGNLTIEGAGEVALAKGTVTRKPAAKPAARKTTAAASTGK